MSSNPENVDTVASGQAGIIEPSDDERAAAITVLKMIWGTHISAAVCLTAELGIADRLADRTATCTELASDCAADEDSLFRVLRLLAGLGLVTEGPPRSFRLTILGDRLRSDAPASMSAWARLFGLDPIFRSFGHMLHSVRTGQPAFDVVNAMPVFEFMAQNPGEAAAFDAGMQERTKAFAQSFAVGYDFSDIRTIVDLGGGLGILLASILSAHSHLQGTLFDLPAVAAGASAVLAAAGVADRCDVIAGDFFRDVPPAADCYVLANVLHDWDDDRTVEILTTCRNAVTTRGRVLVAERLIPEDPATAVPALLSDINMLVLTGGRERTNAEYEKLFLAAGLRLCSIRKLAYPYGLFEATRCEPAS